MTADYTRRFSSRVADYAKYRPGYPQALVSLLKGECGLTHESVVADVGSGTGILSELFLRNGNRVYGVEPNREMREAGEQLLAAYPNFVSVEGRAEASGTPFLEDYERLLLEYGTDYREVSMKYMVPESLSTLFGGGEIRTADFDNEQVFDFEGLRGRLASSSYAPQPGHPNFEPMMRALEELFRRHEREGRVHFTYETKVFYGRL
jgi:SAM-dependent methyltransferase